MDRYTDEELEEAGYFCPECHLNPCCCEFLEAFEIYGDIICDEKANILVGDLYSFKEKLDKIKEYCKNKYEKGQKEYSQCQDEKLKDNILGSLNELSVILDMLDKERL